MNIFITSGAVCFFGQSNSSKGANSFLQELTSIEKGDKNKRSRVSSPEMVPI